MKRGAKITSKGQITVPKEIRDRLGVKQGDELEFVERRGWILLRKKVKKSPFGPWLGHLRARRGESPDDLVREMREAD